jgi:hypothetical protein
VLYTIADCYYRGNILEKNQHFAKYIFHQLAKTMPDAELKYAVCLLMQHTPSDENNNNKSTDVALDSLKSIVKNQNNNPDLIDEAHYWLGKFYCKNEGDFKTALEHLLQVTVKKKSNAKISITKIFSQLVKKHFTPSQPQQVARKSSSQSWHEISNRLQGYDITETKHSNLKNDLQDYRKTKKELKKIEKELKHARETGKPKKETLLLAASMGYTQNVFSTYRDYNSLISELEELEYAVPRKELQRAYKIEERFFRANKIQPKYKQTAELTNKILLSRFMGNSEAIDLTNIPPRRIIKAERAALEISKQLGLSECKNRNLLGWIRTDPSKDNLEKIIIDGSIIRVHHNPLYENHLGNCEVLITNNSSGNYNIIHQILLKACQSNAKQPNKKMEISLVKYMLKYASTGTMITLEELIDINPEADDKLLQQIREIFFIVFVKEISRRSAPTEAKYNFPAASMLIRSLKLIKKGSLSLTDVFTPNAPYGVSTTVSAFNNHEDVIATMNRTNTTYREKIYSGGKSATRFFKDHPKGEILMTRKELTENLSEFYGVASDTEDGYSSSEDFSPDIPLL